MAEESNAPPPQLSHRVSSSRDAAAHTSSLQSPPPVRNRLLRRQTSSFESLLPIQGQGRRRSSILSDFSLDDARQSLHSSTRSLLLPKISEQGNDLHQEPSHWHSAPLAFALIPAIAGLFFQNGTAFATDILLLALAAIFLNWSVRLPWEMYRDAQSLRIQEPLEESGAIESSSEEGSPPRGSTSVQDSDRADAGDKKKKLQIDASAKVAARQELRSHEVLALACCFLGPMFGAYLLHTIRAQLSRPSEGLVSNYNLTIFLLAAELRPSAHLIRLIQARTLHLQRTVQTSPFANEPSPSSRANIASLESRIAELENHLGDLASSHTALQKSSTDTAEVTTSVNRALQPQLDALNRAVRRYEKRSMTTALQTEARLQDLEKRLRDALSLAAAAADRNRRPGFVSGFIDGLISILLTPFQVLWGLCLYPIEAMEKVGEKVRVFLLGPRPVKKKKGGNSARNEARLAYDGNIDDHGAFHGARMGIKSTRR
ncbi:MAG: hypothetical protein M1820_000203 [Bogoriella megaspora]|nr:MAG: hypothetical protein M1820_000203 [Bogoriella megaspora]